MIKLFWNTHNLKKTVTIDNKIKKKEAIDYKWGIYHKENSDKWIYEILEKISYKTINSKEELKKEDILIIIDSSVENKVDFYSKIKTICSKIILFHLGDETGIHDVTQVYDKCNYVLRSFCSNKYFKNKKVKCIPIGYKSGIKDQQIRNREYKWAFTGTPHKSSRHDLLFQLSDIEPFFLHKTDKFDEKIISVEEMSEVLSSTQFMPCPNGFVHPETYRVYEALECGCIPIVENTYNYYDRLFPDHPFIQVEKWIDVKPMIKNWNNDQVKKKTKECEAWWESYKNKLKNNVKKIII